MYGGDNMNKPTKAEIEQYEALKEKMDKYRIHRRKIKDELADTMEIIKKRIYSDDLDVSFSIEYVPLTYSSEGGITYGTNVIITIGGQI